MNRIVAVGSTRPLKVRAVSEALQSWRSCGLQVQPAPVASMLDPAAQFEVRGVEVSSGVGHTPLSRSELMAGARGRVAALAGLARQRGEAWGYLVGLEGGLDVVHENGRRVAFLESWAFVSDAAGRESWGHAGGVMLPEALAAEVLDRGAELSAAIDAFAGAQGIRDAQGAWGVLTSNLITRQDVLRAAVINAFAPFFNASAYSR
jgi:inosine/xanthosine triphosphatase